MNRYLERFPTSTTCLALCIATGALTTTTAGTALAAILQLPAAVVIVLSFMVGIVAGIYTARWLADTP